MRKLFPLLVIVAILAACGNRTPLALPKPAAKPPVTVPAPGEAK